MKNIILVILALGAVYFVYTTMSGEQKMETSMDAGKSSEKAMPAQESDTSEMMMEEEKMGKEDESMSMEVGTPTVVNVEGGMFYFKPNVITVKKGETVKVVFKNMGGMHDFVVDDLSVKTAVIKQNETAEVTFVADKAGTFEYYCSVGDHRARGMIGTLQVEE